MTREELEMRKIVRESDVIDKTDESELAKAFKHLWNKYIEQEPCEDPDMRYIYTQGLEEGIRCAMCTNSMKSDIGCDGGCIVDNVMYKKVMDTIYNHIFRDKGTIKASEQEPCEDCISRPAVLSLLHFHRNDDDKIEGYVKTKDILNLPSVMPTRKKGKWINGDPICPCCGENKFKDLDAGIWADWKPKFCPNCGAKMESEE